MRSCAYLIFLVLSILFFLFHLSQVNAAKPIAEKIKPIWEQMDEYYKNVVQAAQKEEAEGQFLQFCYLFYVVCVVLLFGCWTHIAGFLCLVSLSSIPCPEHLIDGLFWLPLLLSLLCFVCVFPL